MKVHSHTKQKSPKKLERNLMFEITCNYRLFLLLMTVFSKTLFTFVGCHFMALTFFT